MMYAVGIMYTPADTGKYCIPLRACKHNYLVAATLDELIQGPTQHDHGRQAGQGQAGRGHALPGTSSYLK